MGFFRLRIINTLLVLLIGVIIGYLMKERSGPAAGTPYAAKYPASQAPTVILPDEGGGSPPEAETARGEGGKAAREAAGEDYEMPVKTGKDEIESAYTDEEPAPATDDETLKDSDDDVLRGSEDEFFRNPARFSSRDLEMDMQMIMARRTTGGWLLNLVRSKGGNNADYLYLEDNSVLGDKPDLKIGYSYLVRFRCLKGDAAAGNRLLKLTPTGGKAAWATGISAVE